MGDLRLRPVARHEPWGAPRQRHTTRHKTSGVKRLPAGGGGGQGSPAKATPNRVGVQPCLCNPGQPSCVCPLGRRWADGPASGSAPGHDPPLPVGQHRAPSDQMVCATAALYELARVWCAGTGCSTTRRPAHAWCSPATRAAQRTVVACACMVELSVAGWETCGCTGPTRHGEARRTKLVPVVAGPSRAFFFS